MKIQNKKSKIQLNSSSAMGPQNVVCWMAWCFAIAYCLMMMAPALAAEAPIESLLPGPGFADGWVIDGKAKQYTEENLYVYINGEAELYLPYGFQVLASALYVRKGDAKTGLVADIYRMGSPLDAFGIYANYRDPDAKAARVGADGFADESQLLFFKERYFVRLSASGTASLDRAVYLACGEDIAKKIPGSTAVPPEVGLLNVPGVVPRTEKYVAQSVLGYSFFPRGLTADARVREETVRLFVVMEKSPEAAARALESYTASLKEAGAKPEVTKGPTGTTLVANDPMYKGVMVQQKGGYLVGVARLADARKGAPLVEAVVARIK